MADAPPSISNPQLPVDSPLAARPPRPAAHPDFRSIVAECMARGDQALAQSDLAAAARHYATAGVTYRFLGAADLAATAFLELAAAHLALGQRDRFAAVAATLRGLRQPGTPEGILFVRV
ncbi:MAG: hypothetical protein ABJC13_24075, partial [Acidobacteriota bacterium]